MNKETAKKYLNEHDLIKYLHGGEKDQLKPDYCDLARLHKLATDRKVFTILEFGLGWSTLILADALSINESKWKKSGNQNDLRVSHPFKIFSIDSSKEWIKNAKKIIPTGLKKYVEISFSEVEAGKFNGRICHFYKSIPDIVPDFIYLDGPDPAGVKGSVNNLSWQNPERTVMSGDILVMEPTLLPRTHILIDGRTNNARFLENNLQRNWLIKHDNKNDISTMELMEEALGKINRKKIAYCLEK